MRHTTILAFGLLAACGSSENVVAPPREAVRAVPDSVGDQPPSVVEQAPDSVGDQTPPVVEQAEEPTPTMPEGSPNLTFAQLVEGQRIGFEPIELKELPAVTFEEFFGRQKPESLDFAEAFVSKLEKRLGKKVEAVFLFNGRSSRNSLAFVYHRDETVRGIELTGDRSLLAWLDPLAGEFDGTTAHRVTGSNFNGGGFAQWDDLLADPTPVAIKRAPDSFKREQHELEKKAYFAFDAVEPDTAYDAKRFEAAFEAFTKARSATPSRADAKPLRKLAEAVGAPLPGDFTALYEKTGGLDKSFYGFDLLSPAGVQDEWDGWQSIYEQWTLDDLLSQQMAESGVHPVYISPRWIPFIDLEGGHFVAVDLGGLDGAPYGQVIVFGRDVHRKRKIADGVTELLEKAASYDGTKDHELYSVFGELRY